MHGLDRALAEALLLVAVAARAAGSPMPAPTPKPEALDVLADVDAAGGCTKTITSLNFGFRGNYHATVTRTIYERTKIVTEKIDCGGCEHVAVVTERAPFWGGHGPAIQRIVFVTATEPARVTRTVCGMGKD
jgi:hypothetical protein